jgi:hypothetical protein
VPQAEICDGKDNDCDGQTDEELTESCASACGPGNRRCVNGSWDSSACPRQPAPDDALACGARGASSCLRCPAVGNGAAVCSDGICGARCDASFLRCSGVPGACVQASWGFESGGTEGFGLAGFPSEAAEGIGVGTVRAAEGSRALVVPVRYGGAGCEKNEVRVQLSHCPAGGGSDLSGKTLSFQVFLDGPALPSGMIILDAGAFNAGVTAAPPAVGRWITIQHRFAAADVQVTGFYFRLFMDPVDDFGVCREWRGTIYLDDFRVQ